jgi:hypothetical protein
MPIAHRDETRNRQFGVNRNADGTWPYDAIHAAVLMDIRDELKRLNDLLHCVNFTQIPATLRGLRRDIAKLQKAAK